MEYDSANRLTKYNGEEVTYDVKGNMTKGPVDGEMTELTYDCRNRLTKAGNVSYTYDCENTRIATEEDGITTEYVTDTGGSLSRMLIAYENVGTNKASETHYYYGAEGLSCQNNNTTGQYFSYHYDNIGSTTLITDKVGKIIEKFAYGTYGELLTEVVNNIRFLYNGSYGVVTDSNGLYYMRARYYNPDIKRFINQDIKVGDISNGQGLNRYAYCEGNPISMVDHFGLCGENANDQGDASKYQWLHDICDIGGLFFDGFDIVNGALYMMEGHPVKAAISFACALPLVGTGLAVASKSVKYASKAGNLAKMANTCMKIGKIGNVAAAADGFKDLYMTADKMCSTPEEKSAYIGKNLAKGLIIGLAAGAVKGLGHAALKKMMSGDIPRLRTSLAERAAVSEAPKGGMLKKNRGSVVWPFGNGGRNTRTVGNNQTTLYRVIRSDENPINGLSAKNPTRNMSVEGHIISGSRNKGSQYNIYHNRY